MARAEPSPGVAVEASRPLLTLSAALRVHQWIKNLLVFVPLLLAHRITDTDALGQAAWAFLALSLCSSGIYVANDLLDLHSDRLHPRKKSRPFASGMLDANVGMLLIPLLLCAGFVLAALMLPGSFLAILALYVIVALAYSLGLKRLLIVDVLILAGLYALRIFAGGLATGVAISEWLIAFSIFFFLSLAFLKRYAELVAAREAARDELHGRGYAVWDLDLVRSLGSASGLLSILVLILYVSSADVVRLYEHPALLWLAGPSLLYWIARMWFVAHRGDMHDDPVVFAVKDPASYLVGGIVCAIAVVASL